MKPMQEVDDIIYHIYAKDRCLYHNLNQEDFEEKWQLLKVMIDLLGGQYTEEDLSYEKLAPKVGLGGPGKVVYTSPLDEDSY